MNTPLYLVVCLLIGCRNSKADFECEEMINKRAACQKVLKCRFDEDFKEKEGFTRYCRCKTVIEELALPENTLTYREFFNICSQHEARLQELWISDAELEHIDNEIFEKYKNLRYVNLSGNRLILNFTKKAKSLNKVDVSNNDISTLSADILGNLESVKMLNLSFNNIEKVNYCFGKVSDLEEIYLSHNRIRNVESTEFEHLKKLKILDLSHNLLTSVDPALCLKELLLNNNKLKSVQKFQCNNVTILNLSQNELKAIDSNTFEIANRIQVLDVSSNKIDKINADNFEKLGNVTVLNFHNNSLGEDIINCDNLEKLGSVKILYLSHNQIAQIYNCTFNKLENLSKLTLLANQLEKIPPSAFSTLTKLQELNLAENKISEIPDGLFDNLRNLKKLNVSHNKLTKFDLNNLNWNPQLAEFDIKSNNIEDLDLQLLKTKLPSLRVLDMDPHLIKCDEYSDVLQYFEENSIVLKSCTTPTGCCEKGSNKFLIIAIVSIVLSVLALVGLVSICKFSKTGASSGVHLISILPSVK